MLDVVKNNLGTPDFLTGVAVAVILAIMSRFGQWTWQTLHQAWLSRQAFDIAGIWIGECMLPSYQERTLEIWRYTRSGDLVTLIFFAYTSSNEKPSKWIGGGVYRGSKLSSFYYHHDGTTYESGVMALDMRALRLRGVYAQFDPKLESEPLHVSDINSPYTQRRINLPWQPLLRMVFGLPPYESYADVKQLFDKAFCTEKRANDLPTPHSPDRADFPRLSDG